MIAAWLGFVALSVQPVSTPFTVESVDQHVIHGQVDRANGPARGAVVMVAGSGAFDRDMRFGRSGTDRDAIFADLAGRMTSNGLDVVRYDRRGVRHGVSALEALDREAYPGVTADNLSRDFEAVYAWTRSSSGLGARCVVVLVQSEGAAHAAGMAARGEAPSPDLLIGIGAPLESKAAVLQWQLTLRDAESLEMMDRDGDGVITNEEVEANIGTTPSGVFGRAEPFLQPDGGWTAEEIETLRRNQRALFEQTREAALGLPDEAPYPDALTPVFSQGWWKSWFTDDRPLARLFSAWSTPMILHYGSLDSQVREARQRPAAEAYLPDHQVRIVSHPGRGHSLGPHQLMGPMDEAIADEIARDASRACGR